MRALGRLAMTSLAATFALIVIGGLVHATGSSLACPDWPLCRGEVFPEMRGGVFYEHGHRLAALMVLLLTIALNVLVFRCDAARPLRATASLALALVVVQAALGAITVLLRLPLLVSTAHLAARVGPS